MIKWRLAVERMRPGHLAIWLAFVVPALLATNSSLGQEPVLQTGHHHAINDVAVSFDSTRVATASVAGDVIVWDPLTRGVLLRLPRGGLEVAFSPDGKTLVAASNDQVKFWRLADGSLAHQWNSPDQVLDVEYHPDGDQVLLSTRSKAGYAVIDVNAPSPPKESKEEREPASPYDRLASSRAHFSPDGRMLGVLRDGVVTIYRWPELTEVARFDLDLDAIYGRYSAVSFAFSHDSQQIVLGSSVEVDNSNYLSAVWNIATKERVAAHTVQHSCTEVGFTPDGKRAWAGGGPTLWSLEKKPAAHTFAARRPRSYYDAAAMSPDGRWMVAGNFAAEVDFWDATSGRLVARVAPRVAAPQAISFSDDGAMMLVNYGESGRRASSGWRQTGVVASAGVSRHKRTALFMFSSRHALAHGDRPALVAEGALSHDGSQLMVHDGDGEVRQMALIDGKLVETRQLTAGRRIMPSGQGHLPMDFDANGARLLIGSRRPSRQVELQRSEDPVPPGPAMIFDTSNGQILATLRTVAAEEAWSVALSPDGSHAATSVKRDNASQVTRVMQIDVVTGETVSQMTVHGSDPARHLRFTPDGKLAVVGLLGNLRSRTLFWDFGKQAIVQSFTVGGPTALRADSREGVIYGPAGKPRRVDLVSGETLGHIEQPEIINPGEFDREGRVMLCDDQNRVDIFDAFTGELLSRFRLQGGLESAKLSHDARYIVSCGMDYQVTLWKKSAEDWTYSRLAEHSMPAGRLLAIDPAAEKFVYRTHNNQTKESRTLLVDIRTGEELGEFPGEQEIVKFAHDGKIVLFHAWHRAWQPVSGVALYDATTCQLIRELDFAPWIIRSATFSPDDRFLLVGCQLDLEQQLADDPNNREWQSMAVEWDSIRLWDANAGTPIRTFSGHRYPVTDLQFNASADLLLSISFDRTNLWNVETGERLLSLQADGDPHRQSMVADSQLTRLVVRVGNRCHLWDLRTRQQVAALTLPGDGERSPSCLTLSPNGEWLFWGNDLSAELLRWPTMGDKPQRRELPFDSPVVAATFRPSIEQLATCHLDGSVRFSSVTTGEEIARFYRFDDANEWLVTTRDGWIDGSPTGLSLLGWRQDAQVLHWEHLTRDRHRREHTRNAINGP